MAYLSSGTIFVSLQSTAFPKYSVSLNGTGITGPTGNGGGTVKPEEAVQGWEIFQLINHGDNTFSFKSTSFPNVYLRLDGRKTIKFEGSGSGEVNGQGAIGAWEKFYLRPLGNGVYNIESATFAGVFLRIDGPGNVVNCQFGAREWERFTIWQRFP